MLIFYSISNDRRLVLVVYSNVIAIVSYNSYIEWQNMFKRYLLCDVQSKLVMTKSLMSIFRLCQTFFPVPNLFLLFLSKIIPFMSIFLSRIFPISKSYFSPCGRISHISYVFYVEVLAEPKVPIFDNGLRHVAKLACVSK